MCIQTMSITHPDPKPPRTAEELRKAALELEKEKKKEGINCRSLEY
jgi:hypothetical protein